ncbi:uncharacterized protein DUF4255 [Sunxiuqinia elliptica]|uniref:Uncharacterized protein DUF4255 n=2 Tax=Sunxiuqinia elliptica TaxID=655355 RepID=A0A1I2JB03_9BACT|nr:uncharacterized protein DUF4255 [Sunxiuqinia elliptica]TDO56373.1 uncharacterized protein DUF4255 [Sunxiuqinia elliptica]SFF52032.1 Protein of unknown function [Sunxiuqinia elliptica]
MIEQTLFFLKSQLNNYLKLRTGLEDKVELIPVLDKHGKLQVSKLAMTLVNIEEERIMKNQNLYRETPQGTIAKTDPKVMVNLYVLFSSNFGDDEFAYRESLKFIAYVIHFFQSHSLFTPTAYPELGEQIDKLTVELFSLSFEQQNNLWASLGAKLMSSVMYKVKLLAIYDDNIKMDAPPVLEANLKS